MIFVSLDRYWLPTLSKKKKEKKNMIQEIPLKLQSVCLSRFRTPTLTLKLFHVTIFPIKHKIVSSQDNVSDPCTAICMLLTPPNSQLHRLLIMNMELKNCHENERTSTIYTIFVSIVQGSDGLYSHWSFQICQRLMIAKWEYITNKQNKICW